ncbi:dihydrofolate synthetase [Streptococcus pneumoniae]|nr:dihydrofolate synthetase [Streptococcus pneumoniae]
MDTQKIEAAVKMIIEAVGENANREGLQETPARVARMYQEIFSGLGQALEETSWPGRLEIVSRDPLMILDGAHNPHAIKALLVTLQERFADYHKEILFTCIKTKALEDMLALLGAMPDTELTLTHFADSRATDESVLKEAAKSRNLSYQDWHDFLDQNLTDKKEEKQTVRIVTGSLYFLSQVRAYLMERKNENGYTKD